MLKLETKADLQRLVDDDIPESLTLDYKASPALAKDGSSRNELCKDVSAFANSAGGQIIYGIVEKKDDKPARVDEGSDIPREWIEQIIGSNIQPRIGGIVITPIDAGNSRNAFVITIPASSTAHQAPDKKYYRRFNIRIGQRHLPFGGGSGSLTIARQASLKTFPLRAMARLAVSPWRAIGSRTFALRECYAMMVCGPGCARPGLRVRDRGRKWT